MKLPRGFWSSPRPLLLIAPFVLLAPVWLAGKALYWGTPSTQFVPWWWQAWQTLRAGELPLWNPMIGMGAPLLANYQSALLYPPTWLYFAMAALGGLPVMAWWQAISVALHLAWVGWGMAALVRKLGKSELAQTVAGLAFSLSGYLVARAHFLSINATVAWLPWVLLAAYNLTREPKRVRSWLWLSLALTMQWLAGHAQIAWYTLLLAIAWTAYWAWTSGRGKRLWQAAIGFAVAAGLAFALSAVQLLPTAEYLLNSQRAAQVDFSTAATYSFWPWRVIGLIAPNFFGNPANGNYWGYGNFWEDAIYVGLLPFLLAVFAVIRTKRSKDKSLVRFLTGGSIISFVLALGNNTPLFEILYRYVPTFALFQAPARFNIWLVFALALLAAIGVDAWRAPKGRALYWSRLTVAGTAAVMIVAAMGFLLSDGLALPVTFLWSALATGIVGIVVAVLNVSKNALRAPQSMWKWLVLFVVVIDLLFAGWGLNPGASLDLYEERVAEPQASRIYLPSTDEYALKYEHLFRFDSFVSTDPADIRSSLLPNVSILDGQLSANNFDPLVPARYAAWITVLDAALQQSHIAMLEQANIGTLERYSAEQGVTFESVPAMPRFRWANCAIGVSSQEEALRIVSESTLDTVVIEADISKLPCTQSEAAIELISEKASTLTLIIEASQPGWLVVADTWYPGWQATVDGQETPIYPADGLFRAVQIDAGRHQVAMRYQPMSFAVGMAITLFALPVFIVLWKRSGSMTK